MARSEKRLETCYVVKHPEHCPAYVIAESWEEATVKAAEFWGVRWGSVVFDCTLDKTMEARRGVCSKCRKIIYSNRDLCPDCEHALRTEEQCVGARMKKTWYLGRKRQAWGT